MSTSLLRMLLLVVVAALPLVVAAQTIPKEKGPARTFAQFNFFCLQHLPDLEGIERAAGFGEYDQLLGDDLAPYVPQTRYEKLLAWRYHDHGEEFILTAMRSKPDDAFKKEMPAYAAAMRTSCALRVPNTKPEALLGELTRALGRSADKSWQDGATRVYSWTHQDTRGLSYIRFHVPQDMSTRAVLEASVYPKS